MKKISIRIICALTFVLGLGTLAGCAQESTNTETTPETSELAQTAQTQDSTTPEASIEEVTTHEPPLMTAAHEGRYESLGATGCYGCHGAKEGAEVGMEGATPLPADHYVGGEITSYELDPARSVCITCHPVDGE